MSIPQSGGLTTTIVVPDGANPGFRLNCTAADGADVTITLPHGVAPGSTITLTKNPSTGRWEHNASQIPQVPVGAAAMGTTVLNNAACMPTTTIATRPLPSSVLSETAYVPPMHAPPAAYNPQIAAQPAAYNPAIGMSPPGTVVMQELPTQSAIMAVAPTLHTLPPMNQEIPTQPMLGLNPALHTMPGLVPVQRTPTIESPMPTNLQMPHPYPGYAPYPEVPSGVMMVPYQPEISPPSMMGVPPPPYNVGTGHWGIPSSQLGSQDWLGKGSDWWPSAGYNGGKGDWDWYGGYPGTGEWDWYSKGKGKGERPWRGSKGEGKFERSDSAVGSDWSFLGNNGKGEPLPSSSGERRNSVPSTQEIPRTIKGTKKLDGARRAINHIEAAMGLDIETKPSDDKGAGTGGNSSGQQPQPVTPKASDEKFHPSEPWMDIRGVWHNGTPGTDILVKK